MRLCRNGHALTDANVYVFRGKRHCRPCRTLALARLRARKVRGESGRRDLTAGERLLPCCERTPDGCWTWTAYLSSTGYGRLSFAGKRYSAHRLAHETWKGPIPDGLVVMHACDNRRCINPDHLLLGTVGDNVRDMVAKGRDPKTQSRKTHCLKGHPYDEENTLIIKGGRKRVCRICNRAWQRAYDAKRRSEARLAMFTGKAA